VLGARETPLLPKRSLRLGCARQSLLAYIRLLYDVEREARDMKLNGRNAWRCVGQVGRISTTSRPIGGERPQRACRRAPKGSEQLRVCRTGSVTRYCEDGDLEIDNNVRTAACVESAVGRRNWMIYGSDHGGRTAAVLTSFITTCKRLGIDPFAYLRDIFSNASAPIPAAGSKSCFPTNGLLRRRITPPLERLLPRILLCAE